MMWHQVIDDVNGPVESCDLTRCFDGIEDLLKGNLLTKEDIEDNNKLYILLKDLGFWHEQGYFVITYIAKLKCEIAVYKEENKYVVYLTGDYIKPQGKEIHDEYDLVAIGEFTNTEELLALWKLLVHEEVESINYDYILMQEDDEDFYKRQTQKLSQKLVRIDKAKSIQKCQTALMKVTEMKGKK